MPKTKSSIPKYERKITCPYCHIEGVMFTPMETIFLARRRCQNCGNEILIVDDKPMTQAEYESLPKSA